MRKALCDMILRLNNTKMKRVITLVAMISICLSINVFGQVRTEAEAMDLAKQLHNGALMAVQKYVNSHEADHLIDAYFLSADASNYAQSCVVQPSDITKYGTDAVTIVKTSTLIMTYLMHEVQHATLRNPNKQLDVDEYAQQFRLNTYWLAKMVVWDDEIISWLWGTVTAQDISGMLAFLEYLDNDPNYSDDERKAGARSYIQMVERSYFDLNCFKTNGKWNMFY